MTLRSCCPLGGIRFNVVEEVELADRVVRRYLTPTASAFLVNETVAQVRPPPWREESV